MHRRLVVAAFLVACLPTQVLAGAQPKYMEFMREHDRVLNKIEQAQPRNSAQLRNELTQLRRATYNAMGQMERIQFYAFADGQISKVRSIESRLGR
jgi:hypothetical protein